MNGLIISEGIFKKSKEMILNLAINFMTDDYSSWQIMEPFHSKRQRSINSIKEKKNSHKKGRRMAIESHTRAWVKSIVWRLIGIVILGCISWAITDSWKEMSLITLLFHSIRVVLYYFHERVWDQIDWGRIKHPLSSLAVNRELEPEDLRSVANQLKELGYLD